VTKIREYIDTLAMARASRTNYLMQRTMNLREVANRLQADADGSFWPSPV
jgi:hypothetical protein